MENVKVVEGDIFKGDSDFIIHQTNCFNTMGAGIAAKIKSLYPEAQTADNQTRKGSKLKLGTYSIGRGL